MAAPTDRVQVVKLERTANGGDDADSDILPAPIDPNEDGLEARGYFVQGPSGVDETTYITRDGSGNMIFRDAVDATERTLSDLLAGVGGGISETQHENLDTLVHAISEPTFEEYTYASGKVTDIVVWTDAGKTTKVREYNFTYTGNKVTQIVTTQYNGSGSPVSGQTMTETISYSGNVVSSITRTVA